MLEIKNLTVRFGEEGTPEAISGINLTASDRQKLFLIGETGSGKSVLLLAVLGMLPRTATVTGSALLDGRELIGLRQKELRQIRGTKIAYIPQGSGGGMNPLLRVGYQVGEPLMIHQHMKSGPAILRAIQALKRFDLGDETTLARKYPHMLSGGMKQRSLIAMGVLTDAPLLFADEPTKGLDHDRIRLVLEAIEKLQEQTLLCVTHDLRFAREAAQDLCVMYASEQVEIAPKAAFFSEPLHPYSKAIIEALPENGLQVSEGFAPPREDREAACGCHYRARCRFCTARCSQKPPLFTVGENRKVRCWLYEN